MHYRASLLLVAAALVVAPNNLRAQRSRAIRKLEAAVWARIGDRARRLRGLSLDSGQFDLRLPIRGEAEEIASPTSHAHDALAVASTRLEPADTLLEARDARFTDGRYDVRIEDRAGNCVAIHQVVHLVGDSAIVRGARMVERCQPLYMADVVRRARRIDHLPLNAGLLTDHWSVASTLTGWADVYADSVVILTSSIALKASYPIPDTLRQLVDSISVGLALGDGSWSIVRRSPALVVDTILPPSGVWRRGRLRFTIPIDSAFALKDSWPVVEVILGAPKTADNLYGIAWTYAHAPKPFFQRGDMR